MAKSWVRTIETGKFEKFIKILIFLKDVAQGRRSVGTGAKRGKLNFLQEIA